MLLQQQEAPTEARYDRATLEKVVALAGKLQSDHQETLSASEIEKIGVEVGLDPVFIQKALTQLTAEERARRAVSAPFPVTTQERTPSQMSQETKAEAYLLRKDEFFAKLYALLFPAAWGALTVIVPHLFGMEGEGILLVFFAMLAPLVLSGGLGWLSAKKRFGFLAGVEMAIFLTLALSTYPNNGGEFSAWYFLIMGGLSATLGTAGAFLRQRFSPPAWLLRRHQPEEGGVTRSELLDLLFTLQNRLESQKQHCAFLSVDVMDSSVMKLGASELAVEHSFGQYRRWVEEVVRSCGGKMQSAAGDGVMCLFPDNASAVRAAHKLQTGVAAFNAGLNRLALPFVLRCGVSAGPVAIEPGMPLSHLQSVVIDRAALLQKCAEPGGIVVGGEVAAAGLVELGSLTPLPHEIGGESAFSWRMS